MRALFVGGTVDNSELDLGVRDDPPVHYPENTGSGQSRYRLHSTHRRDGKLLYAVYAAPDLAESEVERVIDERDYARRFGATG
ncbi:hypothetical protein [Coralloluteibacterium thermophilus]|uniref:RES domain-containing protein n=1 Tax=Coralloluteibacterium thermophilum TaxID=2707049 RepID=A0ABV9NL22_9GAMM